jgi:hypothetical protein
VKTRSPASNGLGFEKNSPASVAAQIDAKRNKNLFMFPLATFEVGQLELMH